MGDFQKREGLAMRGRGAHIRISGERRSPEARSGVGDVREMGGGLNTSLISRKCVLPTAADHGACCEDRAASDKRHKREGVCHEQEQTQLVHRKPKSELLRQSLKCRQLYFCRDSFDNSHWMGFIVYNLLGGGSLFSGALGMFSI